MGLQGPYQNSNEYDQEMPWSKTVDQHMVPWGRDKDTDSHNTTPVTGLDKQKKSEQNCKKNFTHQL